MIADINKNVEDCKVSSFADDTKISKRITSKEDEKVLQKAIDVICDWAEENNMFFNGNKFLALEYRANDKDIDTNYNVKNDGQITNSQQAKDLGVIMTTDAEFSEHHRIKLAAARKIMGIILRTFKTRKAQTMLILWKSFIIPIL